MSLTSSLFAGVTGLNAQGNVLGILGDNISNISTVGFKAGSAGFSSLVTGDSAQGGGAGVTSFNRARIDQQGLVQSTGIATDIAVSGNGFFVVEDDPTDGQVFYTRAGSFRQDDRGFFVNASGFFLQAWPLDSEGRLPGEIGNENTTSNQLLESLEAVNTRDISGVAFGTSQIDLGLNLDADQSALLGAGDVASPVLASVNDGVAADSILVPTVRAVTLGNGRSADNGLEVGDTMEITVGNNTAIEFVYGGFATSVDIGTTSIYGASNPEQEFDSATYAASLSGAEFTATVGGESFSFGFGVPGTTDTSGTRFFNSLQSMADAMDATSLLNASVVGGQLYVSATDARNAVTFADVTGTIIADATAGSNSGLSGATAAAFGGITAAAAGVNRFNTLDGLATLINEQDGLIASISSFTNNSELSINTIDPLSTITFANGSANGANMLNEFGMQVGTATDPALTVSNAESTAIRAIYGEDADQGDVEDIRDAIIALDDYVQANAGAQAGDAGYDALVVLLNAAMDVLYETGGGAGTAVDYGDPLGGTVEADASDLDTAVTALIAADGDNGATHDAAVVTAIAAVNTLRNAAGTSGSAYDEYTAVIPIDGVDDGADDNAVVTADFEIDAVYAAVPPTNSTSANMASGDISPAFSRNIRVFDSLGVGHDVRISFIKADDNVWLAEVFAANEDEIITTNPNGLLAYGQIEFNGDGSLRNVDSGLANPIAVTWANQANAQEFSVNFGTAGEPAGTLGATQIGLTDGLSQFAGDFTVQFAEQNGSSAGLLSSIEIDGEGFVIANFSNGESRAVYKVPVANFPNPNGLAAVSGNVFSQSEGSGEFTLNQAGESGAGTIESGALEGANVELADELTQLIIAQRAFQANTNVIQAADELLQELNNI